MSDRSPQHRIKALARPGKWYLGGLDGVVWAPPFPRWLDHPGFWDPVHMVQYELGPCFSVALLDAKSNEIPVTRSSGSSDSSRRHGRDIWRPGTLTTHWTTPADSVAVETRRVLPGGLIESSWTLAPELPAGHLVAFTAQPAGTVSDARVSERGLKWTRSVTDRTGHELAVRMEILASRPPAWRSVLPSEGGATPDWELSPFAERGTDDLPGPGAADDPTTPPHHTTTITTAATTTTDSTIPVVSCCSGCLLPMIIVTMVVLSSFHGNTVSAPSPTACLLCQSYLWQTCRRTQPFRDQIGRA